MTSEPKVYIVGVGLSPLSPGSSPTQDLIAPLVSAATKALLDAGVTYDDIDRVQGSVESEISKQGSKAFNAFDEGGSIVDEVGSGSAFASAFDRITDHGAHSVLMMAVEKSSAVALLLVSESFLWRRRYLIDEASLVRRSGAPSSKSGGQAGQGLYDICQRVWALRGWSRSQGAHELDARMLYQGESSQSFELSRADGKGVPEWKEIEHKQDGKYRLGYNPALETRDISQEDFEAVRASGQGHKTSEGGTQFRRKGGDRAALAKL